jgi:RNA polymerase sigma-70 factor (ECF subfamily)
MSESRQQPFGFQTTQWSLVVEAGQQIGKSENQLLGHLCERYWRPLYLFARRSGQSSEAAEDAVQGFFAQLLSSQSLKVADRTRGRFRSFLLTSFTNYLRNQHSQAMTLKRGGATRLFSLDVRDAEGEFVNQPCLMGTPEEEFDRQWAISVLNSTLDAMRDRYAARGKLELFNALATYLGAESVPTMYEETAELVNRSPSAVKVAVHRLRREYRDALLETVAATLQHATEVDDELNILLTALNPRR